MTKRNPAINIIRVEHDKTNPFFMMVRSTAQDETLSWDALGVLTYLLSKPDDWTVMVPDLQKRCGRDKAKKILAELEAAKYLTVDHKVHDGEGKFAPNAYKVNETPFTENPSTVKPCTENPLTENPQVHSIDRQDTDSQKKESTDIKDSAASADTPPISDSHTVEEKESVADKATEYVNAVKPRNLTMDAICTAFGIDPGGYAQLLCKQLTGVTDNLKGKRLEYLINDPPMNAVEILATRDWYGTDTRYKEKGSLPQTAEIIYERVLEFRAQPDHDRYVQRVIDAQSKIVIEPEPVKELPPIDSDQLKTYDAVINALANKEPINELISA